MEQIEQAETNSGKSHTAQGHEQETSTKKTINLTTCIHTREIGTSIRAKKFCNIVLMCLSKKKRLLFATIYTKLISLILSDESIFYCLI